MAIGERVPSFSVVRTVPKHIEAEYCFAEEEPVLRYREASTASTR